MKGSKRYGRRSTPEFIQPVSDLSEVANANEGEEVEEVREDSYDSAVPRKREVKGPRRDPDGQAPPLSLPQSGVCAQPWTGSQLLSRAYQLSRLQCGCCKRGAGALLLTISWAVLI